MEMEEKAIMDMTMTDEIFLYDMHLL